jgi:hypothetical protein
MVEGTEQTEGGKLKVQIGNILSLDDIVDV